MRIAALLFGTLALSGCAAQTTYLRLDGQDIASNPALRRQLDLDRTVCLIDVEDDQACMAIKGYVSVRKDQAARKQQELASLAAAERAEREAAAALPPPRPNAPR